MPIEFRDQGYDLASDDDRLSCHMSEDSFGEDRALRDTYAQHLMKTQKGFNVGGDESPMLDYSDLAGIGTALNRNETPIDQRRSSNQDSRVVTPMSNKLRPNKDSNLGVQQSPLKTLKDGAKPKNA